MYDVRVRTPKRTCAPPWVCATRVLTYNFSFFISIFIIIISIDCLVRGYMTGAHGHGTGTDPCHVLTHTHTHSHTMAHIASTARF